MPPSRRTPDAGVPASRARARPVASLVLALILAMGAATRGDSPTPTPGPTDLLERAWPGHPEWLAMLAEILSGRSPSPGAGWYRKGVSRTRFDWKALAGAFDRDHDGAIARDELPRPGVEFDRLDRDRDGRLTGKDFEFAADRAGGSAGLESFGSADGNGDGKLSRREFEAFARFAAGDPVYRLTIAGPARELEARLAAFERESSGFLTLADFQEAFDLGARGKPTVTTPTRGRSSARVDKATLFRAFLRQELGAFGSGPDLDAPAPDFTLATADGREEVTLSKLVGPQPIVLIFGNFSCGPFRGHAGSLERLSRRYQDRAKFVVVYTREAHPADGWQFDDDRNKGIAFNQPRDLPERSNLATACGKALRLEMPVLVDSMDDRVSKLYSGMPSRLYLIDGLGKIAYKGGRGPFGFKPAELEQSLLLLLPPGASTNPPFAIPSATAAVAPTSKPFRPIGSQDEGGMTLRRGLVPWMACAGLALVAALIALAIVRARR